MAMLAILAWLAMNIFWLLTTKETTPPPLSSSTALETEPRKIAQMLAARHLFGETVSVSISPAAVAPIDLQLSGVIAAQRPGQTAMAFLAEAGKPAVAVREGDEAAPGAEEL